jgi:hypothetical protein
MLRAQKKATAAKEEHFECIFISFHSGHSTASTLDHRFTSASTNPARASITDGTLPEA